MPGHPIPGRLGTRHYTTPTPSALTTPPSSYLLNIKDLPYRTQWLEYPDIAGYLKALGVPPTAPGTIAPYTLPAIYDPKTKRFVAESAAIAAYLDDTYPATPAVMPKETRAFHVRSPFLADALN